MKQTALAKHLKISRIKRKSSHPLTSNSDKSLLYKGFFDDALVEYAKAAQHQPDTAQDLYELAVIFNEKGNTDGATRLYQRTIETEPTHATITFRARRNLLRQR